MKTFDTLFATLCLRVKAKMDAEPWRHYHTWKHVQRMLDLYSGDDPQMLLAILFHDSVYEPRRFDNEYQSAKLMQRMCHENGWSETALATSLIMSTASLGGNKTPLEKELELLDLDQILNGDFSELVAWEEGIFKEYQWAGYHGYLHGRKDCMNNIAGLYSARNTVRFPELYDSFTRKRRKVGLYVGSFNPFHVGHLDVVKKAAALFDKVVICQCVNPCKLPAEHSINDLQDLRHFQTVRLENPIDEIVDLVREYYDVTLVRGLRNGLDLAYEFDYRRWLGDMGVDVPIVYIPAADELTHVSSSGIRSVESMSPGKLQHLLVK